jgi:hypothetical protein
MVDWILIFWVAGGPPAAIPYETLERCEADFAQFQATAAREKDRLNGLSDPTPLIGMCFSRKWLCETARGNCELDRRK